MRSSDKRGCFAAIALVLTAVLNAHAQMPLKLPGAKTFEQLDDTLTELETVPGADSVRREIVSARQLLVRGRLWVDAGRLRRAGFVADKLTLTIKLIRLLQKNAKQETLAKQAEQRTDTLSKRAAELRQKLDKLIAETNADQSRVLEELPADAPADEESQ